MASIQVISYVQATVNGITYKFGSTSEAQAITAAGDDVNVFTATVATETTVTLWDDSERLADFDFLLVACDQNLMLELQTDSDNDVGIESYTLPLTGSGTTGTWGVPFILTRDDSYANYTANFAGGTLDVIELVRVRNLSASTTAQAFCMLFS